MFILAGRNLTLVFRDKAVVCLSFLAEAIVIALYILFIRDNLLKQFPDVENIKLLLDVWMIAGVLGITAMTTTMGAFGVMVEDRAKGIWRDFLITPVKRYQMVGGYMLAALMIGSMMSVLVLVIASVYIRGMYDVGLLHGSGLKIAGLILLNTISNSSMVMFLVSFIKSSQALASCCTIIGSLIGFLTGIYLPMGSLPEYVGCVVRSFPLSHGVVLFRKSLMNRFLKESFVGADAAQEFFMNFMGIQYVQDGKNIPSTASVMVLVCSGIFFSALSILHMVQMKEK